MAEEITCPACEAPNDPWNELCEACGAELYGAEPDATADQDIDAHQDVEDDLQAAQLDAEAADEFADDVDDEAIDADSDGWAEESDSDEWAEESDSDEWDDDEVDEDEWDDEIDSEAQFDLEDDDPDATDVEDGFEEDDEFSFEDDVAADGGAPLDAPLSADTAAELSDATADSQVESVDDEISEQPPPPPELEAILNVEIPDREPIEALPTPGPHAQPATLAVYRDGQQLGEVAIDFSCTVLGLQEAGADRPEALEVDQDDFELEPIDDEAEAIAHEGELDVIEAEPLDAPFESDVQGFETEDPFGDDDEFADDEFADDEFADDEFADDEFADDEFADDEFADDEFADDEFADDEFAAEAQLDTASDVDDELREPSSAGEYREPEDVQEGPVIDLSQYGDADAFASRHGYVFRHNKRHTLYVLSDAGTQLNDEVLHLGEHRRLNDGDVIVLGGEVALRFNEPAA